MQRAARLVAALALAALCAPGTFVRSDVERAMPRAISHQRIAPPAPTSALPPGWQLEGVWQFAGEGRYFGGFSALIAADDGTLRAFSDRGVLWKFAPPTGDSGRETAPRIALVPVAQARANQLWDIESATRNPVTGTYWLGYEYRHAIRRFTAAGEPDGWRDLEREVDWYENGGLEAFARLADGRFVGLPEGRDEGLLFASDPVEGGAAQSFVFESPAPGFSATDLAQLPDGRVLVLLRDLAWQVPPFAARIAIGDPPDPASPESWRPALALDLGGVLPPENYEGLAVRPRADGRVDVWVLSDDNFSILQRTLLARLVFDPAAIPRAVQAAQEPAAQQ